MTEREALEETIVMWTYLAEVRATSKQPYLKAKQWLNMCACCEFTKDSFGTVNCSICPLKDKWIQDAGFVDEYHNQRFMCEHISSPFRSWSRCWDTTKIDAYAWDIVRIAKEALAELNKSKQTTTQVLNANLPPLS